MRLHSVRLQRDDTLVFNGLSLQSSAHRLGLIGPNGAGKSSLLRMLQGLLEPDAGDVDIERPCGLLFQSPDSQILFPTVAEELCFGLEESGLSQLEANQRARHCLEVYGDSGLWNAATDSLSEGQKQLINLVGLLALGPKTLLLDEPFSSLDLPHSLGLSKTLRSLPQRLIISSHNLEQLGLCDELIWMEAGSVRAQGEPSRIISAYEQWAHNRC